jgi:hypothetical protein
MRKTRIGKRIYVRRVPVRTAKFCPYCCATVDMALLTSRGTGSRTRTSARLTHLLGYSGPPLSFGDVSGRNHKETYASCVDSPASSTFNASRSVSSRGSAERDKERKPRSGLEPLTCSSYEFAYTRSSPSYCVRKLRLSMRISMIWRLPFVHCVPVRISPVAVRLYASRLAPRPDTLGMQDCAN